jgi:peptidyl-prolyl cis-trans isomerase SurA
MLGLMERSIAGRATVPTLLILATAGCSGIWTEPDVVVARVKGEAIRTAELDREYARGIAGADPPPTEQEAEDLKLQLLSEMISNRILLQLAEEDGLSATEEEVDRRFEDFRSQYPRDRFQEMLDEQQVTEAEVRAEMRETLTIEKLINKEVTSRITVSDAEIEGFYAQNAESFNRPPRYRFAHILVTPFQDPSTNNQEGDDADSAEEAIEKSGRLLREVRSGQDFHELARRFSEDPSTALDGGDVGFQPAEAISVIDESLLSAVLELEIGETLPRVVRTRLGYHVLKLIDREEGGQKDLSDPSIESEIRRMIFNARDQTLRGAFYETARNQAEVENFLARRMLESAGAP